MEVNNSNGLTNTEKRDPFLIVGIGASAGGIYALKVFFQHVPLDSGIAYVVILHLSPDHDSQLAAVLQVGCAIPVLQVTENTKILPGHVYVIPPNQHLIIQDGFIAPSINIRLEERRAPVDIFFRNLADTHGQRAVCVILSGTGANGSMGLKRIKEMGGAAYVQNPQEAEFNEMPRNAIATTLVDEVLPVREIPERIIAYRNSLDTVQIIIEPEKRPESQQLALRQIFTELRTRTGHDFSNYKRPTLLRRVERRLHIRSLPDLPSYAAFLYEHAEESGALLKDLLISVTNFFRDKKPFSAIEQEILPSLLKGKSANDQVRIWVAGCATGEEAYSIAMLCAELTIDIIDAPRIQIFATDIDDTAINGAREGFYTINDAADVSGERLARFFQPEGDGYLIRREIREMILFANHNFLKDPPFSHLDLITCRNVLIYLNTAAQKQIMETFHFALKPGGFLFLGTSESVDGATDLFTTFSRENHIFQAREVSARQYPVPQSLPSPHTQTATRHKLADKEPGIIKRLSPVELHHELLEQYAPPSVVITKEYEIIHLSESAGKYLEFHGGELTKNLLQLVRSELRLELRSALYKAVLQDMPVKTTHVKLTVNGQEESVNLLVRPVVRKLESAKGYFLVIFEQNVSTADTDAVQIISNAPVAKLLEEELMDVKYQLRNYVEQHQLQAEELNARNEELQAMNEELRSSSEELETSKEELQSINEELRAVNQEMKVKIEETTTAGNNLQNLVNSADVATIFLDRNFRIRMFTPAVFEIFNVRSADHGRPITDITHKLQFSTLLEDAETVLETLIVIEREISTTDHRSFLMRLLPYRTADSINGVVITFYEITKRRAAEKALQRSEEHLRLLIESAKDYAIFTLDPDRRVVSWSVGAETIMGYSESEIKGQLADIMFTVDDQQAGVPAREAEIADKEGRAENERWHLRKNGSKFWGSGSVSPLRDQDGKLLGFVKIMRDLTEARRLEEARSFLASIVDSTKDSIITIDFERTITSWNKAAENLYGYTAEEAIGKSLTMLTLPADLLEILKNIDKIEHDKQVTVFDTVRVHKNGQHIDLEIVLSPVLNNSGETIGVSTIARSVTERKRREAHLALLADLSQGLIGLSVSSDIGQEVLKKIGDFFGASVCAFTQVFTNEDNPLHFETWVENGNKHIKRKDDLPEYGVSELLDTLSQGAPVIISDITLDSRMRRKEEMAARGIVSLINVPLMRFGQWSCSISLYLDRPYNWHEDEVVLLRETGIRIWNSIERAKAEEASRISEGRFHTLIDAIPQVIWTNDAKGKADYFNKRWFEYSGLSFEASYGLGWEAIVHPDDAAASKTNWHASLAAGDIFDTEYRLKSAKGEYRWHIGRNVPLKDHHGHVVGWFGSATDIENLKSTEVLLRQTADRLQLALEAGHLGSYEYNFTTNETVCTAQHKQNFGILEMDECPFEILKELSVAEDREYVEKALEIAIEQHTSYSIEFRIELGKGNIRWIKSVGRTIVDQQGNTEKMVGITLDITEQKLFTNQLQKQVDERTIELQRSNDDLRQFAHVASHDLKEPVRKIKTFYSRIVDEFSDALPEKVKTYLDKINTATRRMYAMVDGVLAYSKLGSSAHAFSPVDLNDVVQQIETDLEVLISTKNATITRNKLPTVTGSEVLIYQLFYNLIMNALKFSKDGQAAKIDISSKRLRKKAMDVFEITIADNGIGFEPEFEKEIFNTFSRLNAVDRYEGTGLGLALCKKIVERHHGSISASGHVDKGATFTILLPAD